MQKPGRTVLPGFTFTYSGISEKMPYCYSSQPQVGKGLGSGSVLGLGSGLEMGSGLTSAQGQEGLTILSAQGAAQPQLLPWPPKELLFWQPQELLFWHPC